MKDSLQNNESLLRSFFDSAGVMRGIVELTGETDFVFVAANTGSADFFGLKTADIAKKRGSDLGIPAEVLQTWISNFLASRKSGKPVTFEYPEKNGETVSWFLATVSSLNTPNGKSPRFAYVAIDITGRKQTEDALLLAKDTLEEQVTTRTADLITAINTANAERYRLYDVLETLPVYVCLLDEDYRMPFANRYFREAFGDPRGQRCYDALFNRAAPCENCETYKVMKTRAPHHWFWTGPNGRDYDIYDFPFTDTDGSFMILEMGIDITDRKRAERELLKARDELDSRVQERTLELEKSNTSLVKEIDIRKKAECALRETGQYLENLINYANAPIIVWDPEYRITLFNRAFEHLTDYMAGEIIGKKLDILLPETYQDEVMTLIRKTIAGERWESVEIPIRQKSGKVRTILWNSAPVYDDSGKTILSIIAQGQDITERKLMETESRVRTRELALANDQLKDVVAQRILAEALVKRTLAELNAAIESTADGIYAVDRAGKITRYNQNFALMWKIPEEILQSGEDREISEYLKTQVKNPLLFTSEDNEDIHRRNRETYDMLELSDGRIFERYSKPQKLDATIIGRVMSYRDVTDRRHAEEKLLASLQEKETLIREIHHRVKNNLQIISGLLDMTRMRTRDKTTHGILTDMMMKIKTMAQIHTRLYESKQFDRINMGQQIRDQVIDLSSIYERSGVEVQTEIAAEEIFLPVDQAIPCALIVNEILSNAFKHAFKGRKTGTLQVSATQADNTVRIEIRDNGIGIDKDVDIYQSTSLGLKLIRNLVAQIQGTVTITSTTGTDVIVQFPLHPGST